MPRTGMFELKAYGSYKALGGPMFWSHFVEAESFDQAADKLRKQLNETNRWSWGQLIEINR